MKNSYFSAYILLIALAGTLLSGCTKDGATGPAGSTGGTGATGATGPSFTGTISGYVILYNEYGDRLGNADSVLATLDNIADSMYTDSAGLYKFVNISTGIYNSSYSKSGYGGVKVSSQQFTGGGTLYLQDRHMSAIPNFNILTVRDSNTVTDAYIIDSLAADIRIRSEIVYVGTTASVSSAPATYAVFYTKNIAANQSRTVLDIPLPDLTNLGFISGQTVYIATYGINANFNNSSVYEDYITGHTVFTAVSASPAVTSFIMP